MVSHLLVAFQSYANNGKPRIIYYLHKNMLILWRYGTFRNFEKLTDIVADTWSALNRTGAICSTYFIFIIFWLLVFFLSFDSNFISCHIMPFRLLYSTFLPTLTPTLFQLLPLLHLHTFRWWRWRCIQCVPVLRYHRRCLRCCPRKRRHHGTARSTCHATPSKVRTCTYTFSFSNLVSWGILCFLFLLYPTFFSSLTLLSTSFLSPSLVSLFWESLLLTSII